MNYEVQTLIHGEWSVEDRFPNYHEARRYAKSSWFGDGLDRRVRQTAAALEPDCVEPCGHYIMPTEE